MSDPIFRSPPRPFTLSPIHFSIRNPRPAVIAKRSEFSLDSVAVSGAAVVETARRAILRLSYLSDT